MLKGGVKPKPPFNVTYRGTADQFQRKRLSTLTSVDKMNET